MTCCSIPGCKNSTENGCSMKILPRSNVPREKWVKSISRTNWSPDEHTFCVCEEHYDPDMAVTLCFDGKQGPESFTVPTIQPQPEQKLSTDKKIQLTPSKPVGTRCQLLNVRIKNIKGNESLSEAESEFEVIEEIEYEVLEGPDDCDQKPDRDFEIKVENIEENLENSWDQHFERSLEKVTQPEEESVSDCEFNLNKDREKVDITLNNSAKHPKNWNDATEKLHKNQENLTPNTDDSFQHKKKSSQSQESFSEGSRNSTPNKEKLSDDRTLPVEKENSSPSYRILLKNKAKLNKSQESDQRIKKEVKVKPKQENLTNPDTEILQSHESLDQSAKKSHLSRVNLIYNSKEKLRERENPKNQGAKIEESKKLNQKKEKCEKKVDEEQENLNKEQQLARVVGNSGANLQNKLILIVKPEKLPESKETLPQNYDLLNKNQAINVTSNDKMKKQVILIKNQNNLQRTAQNSKPNGVNSVKNQVILIKNPNKVPEAKETGKQTGVDLAKNQLFLILKQDPSSTEQISSETRQKKPQVQNHSSETREKLPIAENNSDNPGSSKRKPQSVIKSEDQSNKKFCPSKKDDNLPRCSEKLTENRRKLSQYLQYLNEASKNLPEQKQDKIKKEDKSCKENTKNVEETQKEKKNEIDDDPFSTNDPEQFSSVNAPASISMPAFDSNENSNNKSNSQSSSSNNNDADLGNKNSGSDRDKINYMNKLIEKQQQLLRVYRNKLGFARYKIKDQEAKLDLWRSMMETIFNEDQISYLEALQSQKKRCKCWSTATIKDALEIKNIIGTIGYEELLRRKYPFPALRTLREKTQKPKADE